MRVGQDDAGCVVQGLVTASGRVSKVFSGDPAARECDKVHRWDDVPSAGPANRRPNPASDAVRRHGPMGASMVQTS